MMEVCPLTGFYSPAQRARLYAATGRRESVRTFQCAPDAAQKSALSYAAARVCLPGCRIEMSDCEDKKLYRTVPFVDTIIGTERYAALIADEKAPHAAACLGISGEAFALEAVALGLGTCWVTGTYRRRAVDVRLQTGERLMGVMALGVPAEGSRGERRRKSLQAMCTGKPEDWPLWAYSAAECVRIAPSAMNLQPWKMNYAGRTLQLLRTGLGAHELDMGIAMLHMSLGAQEKEHVVFWGEGQTAATLLAEDRE